MSSLFRSFKGVPCCMLIAVVALMLFTCHSVYAAESTIRVLLLENSNSKVPRKDERVEKLSSKQGEVLLGGLKYTGNIEVWKGEQCLYVINEIPFEEYIKGVVAAEVGANWEPEALKAQAVAARTYALFQKQNSPGNSMSYHLTSSVLHQSYKGNNVPENVARAVRETRGEILTFEGKPIVAYYHSTSGGVTEDPLEVFGKSYPYLKSIETNCELSPFFMWEKRIPVSELEHAANVSAVKDVVIASYTLSQRARELRIFTEKGEHTIPAKDLRKALGWDRLPSTLITKIVREGDFYIFEGRGYGHGVGMCQWSAQQMAKEGKTYMEILFTFYPGTVIENYEDR